MSVWQLLFLMVPAYVANMAPVLVKWWKWTAPLDCGLAVGGARLLGDNKTWRGVIAGTVAGAVAMFALSFAYWPFAFSPVLWGLLAGCGALVGDAVESFVKRRLRIQPGEPWVPFDQLDYAIGALVLGSVVFFPGWASAVAVVVLSAVGHVLVNHIGYALGVRKVKW